MFEKSLQLKACIGFYSEQGSFRLSDEIAHPKQSVDFYAFFFLKVAFIWAISIDRPRQYIVIGRIASRTSWCCPLKTWERWGLSGLWVGVRRRGNGIGGVGFLVRIFMGERFLKGFFREIEW
jgi:hypothetical protein